MKKCNRCEEIKLLTEFYKAKGCRDGLQSFCKKCDNARKTELLREKSIKAGKKQKTLTLVARELRSKRLKRCPGCKETKEFSSFYSSKASNDNLASHCILCANKMSKLRPKEERSKKYKQNKNRMKNNHLMAKFGISLYEYDKMLKEQNNVCAI